MSFRLTTHTPTIGAAPGESVIGRVEIHNDGASDAIYTVVVVGLAPGAVTDLITPTQLRVPVPAGSSVVSDIVVVVPRTLGIGQHAAAFEATSSRPSDRAALTPFTVSIQSVSRVELIAHPSTIRARRKANFHLDVSNNEPMPVEVELIGEAPDVAVSFTPSMLLLQPGQRVVTKGRIKGPRRVSGESTQHNILITARGRASTTSVTAAYVQRPLFAHRLRMAVAALTVIALWLTAIGGALLWLSNRDDGIDAATELIGVDTNGDGIPDAFRDAEGRPVIATDTNGDGIPDTLSNGSPLPGKNQETTTPESQPTILRGTVQIDGSPTTVAIALTPIELGAAPAPAAAPIGLRSAQPSEPEGKIWSARTATLNDLLGSTTRRTVAIAPDQTVPGADGVWLFTDILQGQSYEVSFSSPGYDTQSFVLTPRADGEPIDLDVEMKPAQGALSGTVAGPSGPLGAAEVRITDGTLDFATTSASGNGTWSLPAVSTPGVYTVTATLRGFATAVRQIRLEPGDRPSGITLQMVPGLGTITGIVTSAGAGLGGVTVTASNGETTLTTTTLTEGNVGFYSLPQLGVPATYTVQATLDGYVTDSRRVPLNGSLGDVNLSMAATTATLTGRVVSSAGGGIESAGLIVSTGDLQFRASTSPTGVFTIDRLAPGDYTITAEHYLHESVTEFTTLVAGITPVPLDITLQRTTGPPAVGTGSLVVSVINDDPKVVPPGIRNARVTISRNRTAETQTLQDTNSSAVTFDNLPIGTYTINVRAEGYNVSAPVTKSVGQTRERAEVQLQKLGQASGSMINSRDPAKAPLPGYSLQLYKLANITDPVGIAFGPPLFDTNGTWTTTESALQTGLYRIQATSPTGFFVRNDQVLDTSPAVGGRTMVFLVPEITDAEVEALSFPPIEADPYPTITSKIYQPRLNGVTVEYNAVDQPLLGVTGTCNGAPVPAADIIIKDTFGPTGIPNQFDTFTLNKEAVARAIPISQLPGRCEFTVTAPGRTDATITLTNIVPSDGLSASDRLAAAALVKTPTPLTGTVFWIDKGTREPLDNVSIVAAAPVITGFASTERSTTTPDPRPVPVLGASSTTSAATTGAWTLTGQVFGVSNYGFSVTNFMQGSVPVTINETSRVIPPSGTNTNVFTAATDGTGFGIELAPPNPGTVSGRVTIQTESTPKYATNMVRATPPIGGLLSATPTAADVSGPRGDFTFANAAAGTWSIDFETMPHHVREPVGTTPPPIVKQLLPGGAISGFDATYTELATVRVRLFDKTSPTTAITLPAGLALALTTPPAPPGLTGTVTNRPSSPPNGSSVYELTGIPVATSSPISNTVGYSMALQLADYDLRLAEVSVNGAAKAAQDARQILLPMVAGRTTNIDVFVAPLRKITGSIFGLQTSGPSEPLPLPGPAELVITRVGGLGTDPAPQLDPGPTPGSFVITAAPGDYQLTPSHPQYQDFLPQTVTLGGTTDVDLAAPFDLTLRTSKLKVNALTKLTSGTQVSGAVFDVYLDQASCTGFPATTTSTEINPLTAGTEIALPPGTYCLAVNQFDSPTAPTPKKQIAFPAIVVITVPRSTATSASVTNVVVPLPALNPTVTGTLVARNTLSPTPGPVDLVAVPAPGPKIMSTFTSNVNVAVNGTTSPNLNPNSSADAEEFASPLPVCDPLPDPLPNPPPDPQCTLTWTFQFASVPSGTNTFTAPAIPGYALPTSQQTVDISAIGPTTLPPFVYTAVTTPVQIALGPGTFPSLDPAYADTKADVFLVSKTDVGAGIPRSYSFVAATNTLVINGVAPEARDWTLEFKDALHANFKDTRVKISAEPNASGNRVGTLKINPVGNLARLTGTVQQRSGLSTFVGLQTGGRMTLVGGGNTFTIAANDAAGTSAGALLSGSTYQFDVPANATYSLTVTQAEYATKTLNPLAVTPLGSAVTQNVVIDRIAVITVTVTRPDGLTTGPAGLNVTLNRVSDGTSVSPRAGSPLIFDVLPGDYYARAAATAPYVSKNSAATTVVIGDSKSLTLALDRYARVAVTGPTAGTEITVTLPNNPPKIQTGPSTFEFKNPVAPLSPAIVSAPGFRTQNDVVIPDAIINEPPVGVGLLGPVTVSGSITGATDGRTITAVSGDESKPGTITGGNYSIPGLDNNANGTDKTWTISYTELGVGTGSTSVIVSGTSDIAETSRNITLVARDVNYDFTVTTSAPAPLSGATVTVFNSSITSIGSGTTAADTGAAPAPPAGTARITVNENTAPARWTVSKSGFLTKSGTIASPISTVFAVLLQPEITGTVSNSATPPAAVVGAVVVVCPTTTPATRCTPTQPDRSAVSIAGGAYTLNSDLAPGPYTIWASIPATGPVTQQGSIGLTIASDGSATLAPPDGKITIAAI